MKNRSHRYDISRPGPKHGQKYTKYNMCLSMIMVICIKQQLNTIWSTIHEKLSNTKGELEKSVAYKKKRVNTICSG